MKLAPVLSLAHLKSLVRRNKDYERLIVITATELSNPNFTELMSFQSAMDFLTDCISTDGEEFVTEEINSRIPLLND